MTKADLVAILAKSAGGTKTSAERAVDAMAVGIFDALRRGRRGATSRFGSFGGMKRAARNGRDPRTGKAIKIPPAKVPRFRPSRALKTTVR